jgi:hypothetical protein
MADAMRAAFFFGNAARFARRGATERNRTGFAPLSCAHPCPEFPEMTNKPEAKKSSTTSATGHTGMMGDGSEEQNLGQPGNPEARIKKDEVDAAFAKTPKK